MTSVKLQTEAIDLKYVYGLLILIFDLALFRKKVFKYDDEF